MRLTRFSDYSLRVMLYLGVKGDSLATIKEIAERYDISKNHLMKVVYALNQLGYVETIRGKNGGMRLCREPSDINLGAVIRQTESELSLVECFTPNNTCPITPACRLKGILGEALSAFLAVLDRYTLADLLSRREQLSVLLQLDGAAPHATSARDGRELSNTATPSH